MIQVIYSSVAVHPFTEAMLDQLLEKARSRNRLHSVTGLLVYESGSFLQVLEGEEPDVNLILSSVQRDPRHRSAKVLSRRSIQKREFGEWEMSFSNTSSSLNQTAGKVHFKQLPKRLTAATEARKYLQYFFQGLCRQT